jgi:purine-binding chemotaxis protein CheW
MSDTLPTTKIAATGPAADVAERVPGLGTVTQYLTFVLAGGEYGVDILRVQEIKGWEGVTRVPHTPPFLLGVMNLRGTVVPVVDLRARFGLPSVAFGPGTVVIVVRVHQARGEKTVGLVVDGVSEVCNFAADDIQPPPPMSSGVDPAVIGGLASAGDQMVMLLDVDRVVTSSIEAELRPPRSH